MIGFIALVRKQAAESRWMLGLSVLALFWFSWLSVFVAAREAQRKIPPPEPTVRCVACGTFLPKSEATAVATGYRCNDPACASRR